MLRPLQLASVLAFMLCFSPIFLSAQSQLGIHLGASNYLGDLVPSDFSLKGTQLSYGAFYRCNVSEKISLRGNVMFGQLKGSDSDFQEREDRGFGFSTKYTEFAGIIEYDFNGQARYDSTGVFQKKTTFYALAGIGGLIFNPDATGLPATAPELAEDYSTFTMVIPVGLGVKIPFSEEITLGVEGSFRIPFSDYLDGISESGNPDHNDRIGHLEVNVAYYFNSNK